MGRVGQNSGARISQTVQCLLEDSFGKKWPGFFHKNNTVNYG